MLSGIHVSTARILLVTMLVATGYHMTQGCPYGCVCGDIINYQNRSLQVTNCSDLGLLLSPVNLPPETQYLDLSGNAFRTLRTETVVDMMNLTVVDTRDNLRMKYISMAPSLLLIEAILTDKGSTCCVYEQSWKKEEGWDSEAYERSKEICLATDSYKECKDNLINITSLTIYTITLVGSLVLNPWVILVNLSLRNRRKDPYILVLVHFSVTNLLLTFYAAMFAIFGFHYLNRYQYYMDDWMDNPVCTIMGFILVTSSIQTLFLCMMVVIHFYLSLNHPLERRKQFTPKRLNYAVLIIWLMAAFIAAIPFFTGDNYYNDVALCLPFHASSSFTGDNNYFNFTFLSLYTLVQMISLAVIVTLTSIIVHSLVKQSRRIQDNEDHSNTTEQQILRENKAVRKALLIKITAFTVFSLVLCVLLLMSCFDHNEVSILGREWFARLCVLQAVFWPIIGSFKHKHFYKDTKRMFQKWNCYDWENNRISLRNRRNHRTPSQST